MTFVFNAEDQYFTNKKEFTEEEMRAFIDSEYGINRTDECIKALEQLLEDAKAGVIKSREYGGFNRASAKAYAKKHDDFYFGKKRTRFTSSYDEDELWLRLDGELYRVDGTWEIDSLIKYIKTMTIESRFKALSKKYIEAEQKWLADHQADIYYKENDSRIRLGEKAYAYMREFSIRGAKSVEVEPGFSNGYHTRVESSYDFSPTWSLFNSNKYGELTYNKEVVPEDQVKEILALSEEFSCKAAALASEYERLLRNVVERKEV